MLNSHMELLGLGLFELSTDHINHVRCPCTYITIYTSIQSVQWGERTGIVVTLRWRVWYRSGLPSCYTCVYEYIEIFFDIFMAAWGLCCATGPWGSIIDSKGHNKVEERKAAETMYR